ncbi:MAG: hypothetical protein R2769_15035 [Saprospiraceae bacterium]
MASKDLNIRPPSIGKAGNMLNAANKKLMVINPGTNSRGAPLKMAIEIRFSKSQVPENN